MTTRGEPTEIRTQIYLPRDLHRELKREAARLGVSMAQVVRDAVGAYLRYPAAVAGESAVAEPTRPYDPDDRYRADVAWTLPELADAFPGFGRSDAAEHHDDLLYGPLTEPETSSEFS